MLRLRSLELTDFGPFKGTQTLNFPEGRGVVVVYGQNMRGKTSLLNALRFAFFGEVRDRGSESRPLHRIPNLEAVKERGRGMVGFGVSLSFTFEGETYQVVRRCVPRIEQPESDEDYDLKPPQVRTASKVLGPGEVQHLLSRAFSEETSRFFLFDGELLQEYEALVRTESRDGPKIKAAIERILGLPVLTNARTHLRGLVKEAEKKKGMAERASDEVQRRVSLKDILLEQREHHEVEVERLSADVTRNRRKAGDIKDFLSKNSASAEKMRRYSEAVKKHEELRDEMEEQQAALREAMSEAWRTMLKDTVSAVRKRAEHQLEQALAVERQRLREIAVESGECPTCLQPVDPSAMPVTSGLTVSTDTESVAALRTLATLQTEDHSDLIATLDRRISAIAVDMEHLRGEIDDLELELDEVVRGRLEFSEQEYTQLLTRIAIDEKAIRDHQEVASKKDDQIRRLDREIAQLSSGDVSAAAEETNLYRDLSDLFGAAIGHYRDALKTEVERDASDLFLQMTTEPEYSGLSINDSYGLTILLDNAQPLPVRSAGAEHVVALSLMGALQRNMPTRGPIVMDSPFGRLDNEHSANVISALPNLADQVLLLVFRGEVAEEQIKELLDTSLLAEITMDRVSARHTRIRQVVQV